MSNNKEITDYMSNLTNIINNIDISEINFLSKNIFDIWKNKKSLIYMWKWW